MKLLRTAFSNAAVTGIAAILLLFSSSSPAAGKGKPDSGGVNLANFTFAFEDSGGIYVTTFDDSNRVKITSPEGGYHASPTWSPDGGLIAYIDYPGNSVDLYVTDGNQSWLVRSFTAGELFPLENDSDRTLVWTPNGREIVFVARANQIVAVEVATGNQRVLLDLSDIAPQGTKDVTISPFMIAFSQQGDHGESPDIWSAEYQINEAGLIEVDAASISNLTNTPGASESRCSFSRDGTYIAYFRVTDPNGLYLAETVVLDLLTMQEFAWDALSSSEMTWSPDGSELCIDISEPSPTSTKGDLVRIANWDTPANLALIPVTDTKRRSERNPDWRPSAFGN